MAIVSALRAVVMLFMAAICSGGNMGPPPRPPLPPAGPPGKLAGWAETQATLTNQAAAASVRR